MLGQERRLESVHGAAKALEMQGVERIARSHGHAAAVQRQRKIRPDARQCLDMRAAAREVILGVRFEPGHRRGVGQYSEVVLGPESNAGSCPETSRWLD